MRARSSRGERGMVDLEGVRRGFQGDPDPQRLEKSKMEEACRSAALSTSRRACPS